MNRDSDFQPGDAVAAVSRGLPPRRRLERPDAAILAAWLEGNLSEAEAAPVEGWIAGDPDAPAEIAALRAALDARRPEPAPARVVVRAQALVRPSPAGQRPERRLGGLLAGLFANPVLRWGPVAAAAAAVALGGFEIGSRGLAPSLQPQSTQTVEAPIDFGAPPSPFL